MRASLEDETRAGGAAEPTNESGMHKRVIIVGGGLAGLAAAVRFAGTAWKPVLIETRKRLGGRATSLVDPRSGKIIDNCQHVLMMCCTNLIDFYARLGVLQHIERHETLYWTNPRRQKGHVDRMRAGWLPAPLHLSASFRGMSIFTKAEKRHIGRAMWRMIRMGARGRLAWADRTFAAFLRACGQPEELIRSFWNTIIVGACNGDVELVGAAYALQVFQEGFLANRASYVMGVPKIPLAELYAPAIDFIIESGGDIQLGVSAKAIAFDPQLKRVTGVVTENEMIGAHAVIAAVPFDRLDKLTSETLKRADRRLQQLDRFEVSPILGVHLWFDQQIMDVPHLVVVDAPEGVQWIFNKGVDNNRADGQHIHAVISGADAWMDLTEDQIVARVMADVHAALPRSIGLQPIEARAIKEKRATFAARPGVESLRPGALPAYASGGGVENLLLAGDWCDTGWPATMEGAVRSGYAAAAAVLGGSTSAYVADAPTALLPRILGLR